MAIAKSVVILILFFALASYADAAVKPRPPVGRDVFGVRKSSKDVLLPGEKLVNVLSFGAKGDGVTDCTQVKSSQVSTSWLQNQIIRCEEILFSSHRSYVNFQDLNYKIEDYNSFNIARLELST
jgi:hypothetical protein